MADQNSISFFESMYDATYPAAARYVARRCAEPARIADILQDTYAEVYAALLKKGPGYFRDPAAFVLHVARAKLRRYYREQTRRRRELPLTLTGDDGDEYDNPELAPLALTFEDDAQTRLLARQVAETLTQKPPEVQQVFALYYGAGLTLREIAKTLGVKESTVKNRLYRTIQQLRQIYGKDESAT